MYPLAGVDEFTAMRCLLATFVCAALVGACGPSHDLPDQKVDGRWVRYHYWKDEGAPCPEAIAEIDSFVDGLGQRLNRLPADGFRLDYYKLRHETEMDTIRDLCRPHAGGCADGTTVYSTNVVDDHEVTHAFMSSLGRPPTFFLEGFAVVFGCGDSRFAGDVLPRKDIEPLVDEHAWSAAFSEETYESVGAFVRSLIERFGMEAVLHFYSATRWDAPRADVDARFRESFGVDLSDAAAEWLASAPTRNGEFCIAVHDRCDDPPDAALSAPASSARLEADVACVGTTRVLEVGNVSATRVRFSADQLGRRLTLRACDPSGSAPADLSFAYANAGASTAMNGRWTELWAFLSRGRYTLGISRMPASPFDSREPAGPGGKAVIDVSAQAAMVGANCSVAALPVTDDVWSIAVRVPQSAIPAGGGPLRLEPSSKRQVAALFARNVSQAPAWCADCDTPTSTSCHAQPAGLTSDLTLEAPSTIWLTPATTPDDAWIQLVLEAP